MNLNKTFVLGRVTADPQLKAMPSGQSILTLGVATNRSWTAKDGQKQEEVEFHNVVLFGKQAEVAATYLKKGSLALFEGRMRTRTWAGKDGVERRTTEIICESLQLGPNPNTEAKTKTPAPQTKKEKSVLAEEELIPLEGDAEDTGRSLHPVFEDEEIKPEDIPF